MHLNEKCDFCLPYAVPCLSFRNETKSDQESPLSTAMTEDKTTLHEKSQLTKVFNICEDAHDGVLAYGCSFCYLLICEDCSIEREPSCYSDGEQNSTNYSLS